MFFPSQYLVSKPVEMNQTYVYSGLFKLFYLYPTPQVLTITLMIFLRSYSSLNPGNAYFDYWCQSVINEKKKGSYGSFYKLSRKKLFC